MRNRWFFTWAMMSWLIPVFPAILDTSPVFGADRGVGRFGSGGGGFYAPGAAHPVPAGVPSVAVFP